MSDDDLIRRGDVLRAYQSQGDERADEFPQWDYFEAFERAIAALPPRGVGVDAVAVKNAVMGWVWAEDSDVSKRLGPKHTDALIARILAALAPAEAGGVRDNRAALLNRFLDDWEDQLDAEMVAELHSIVAGIDHQTGTDLAALAPAEAGGVEAHPYSLRPDLQRIVDNAKTAPHWDTERDRLAHAPVDALVKAAEEAAEVVHKAYVSATMEAVNAGPSHPLRDNFDKWRVRCLRAEEALRAALAALRGDAKMSVAYTGCTYPKCQQTATGYCVGLCSKLLKRGGKPAPVEALVVALHDAINSPKGVVPASAEAFYNPSLAALRGDAK